MRAAASERFFRVMTATVGTLDGTETGHGISEISRYKTVFVHLVWRVAAAVAVSEHVESVWEE